MSEEEKKAKIELLNIPRLSVKRQNARDIILKAIDKKDKVIDLMATELSRRPLMIYLDDERDDRLIILDNPKEIIKYYTKKADEEIQKNKAI